MWEHCSEPIGVEDLARTASMSLRSFHDAFVKNLGRSPGSELHRIRIERARKLLADSNEKPDAVAHAELHRWRDPRFIALKDGGVVLAGSPDTLWMWEHFTAQRPDIFKPFTEADQNHSR